MVALRIPGSALLLCALVLSFLVSISLPFLRSLDITRIDIALATVNTPNPDRAVLLNANNLRLGIWASCAYDDQGDHQCTQKGLGYEVGFLNILDSSKNEIITSAWTRGLVLHPIATGFILIAFLTTLSTALTVNLVAFLATCFATLVTFIAFIIDIALFAHARSVVKDVKDNNSLLFTSIEVHTAPGFWLSFVAVVLLIAASITFCIGRRRETLSSQSTNYPMQQSKGRFWAEKFQSV